MLRPGLRLSIDPQAREPFEWFCFRSPEMVRELDGFLAQSAGCRRLLDVGACHGLFALAFTHLHAGATALAIEPSPIAWEILEANLQSNPGCRITPLRTAVGAASGTLRMRFAWHHLEASTAGEEEEGTVAILVRTLDEISTDLTFRPDVLKIDVEGYEVFALEGARRILREDRPLLFLEVHPLRIGELGGSLRGLWDLLTEHGYQIRDLGGAPFNAAAFTALDATARLSCTPAETVSGRT